MNKKMESMLEKFSSNTEELLGFITEMEKNGIEKLTNVERSQLLKQLEIIEDITGKAETLSQKTKRDGVPELEKDQKSELKLDVKNKQDKKSRISNLMKPSPKMSMQNTQSENEKNKKEREKK